ncbi:MAG: hypothetical protein E6Q58_02320 [Niabella sp.]|nr:MAG: hypothetical protein E6Q58_02320 [Niabella sp.]
MLLVNSTMLRKMKDFNVLAFTILFVLIGFSVSAQDNSPYSRYGLGNQAPTTNVANRGMGGVAAAYNDAYTVNYANPSSYAFFQTTPDPGSRKINSGRVTFNIGADGQGRTLTDQNAQAKFTSTNILFSHVMVGAPLRKNWGMAFGLRPLTSINYKIKDIGKKFDPHSGKLIDSSNTLYEGQGGVYLGSIGTGVKFKTGKSQYLSLGVNAGYMFGSKDYNTRVSFINDSTRYANGNYENKMSIKGLYFDAGMQYHFKASEKIYVGLGAYGNWKQKINTSKNSVAETFVYSSEAGNIPIDTATFISNEKGSLIYPSSVTGGFSIQKVGTENNEAGWMVGVDFTKNNWNKFRIDGSGDADVRSNWQAKVGAEFRPAAKKSYLSHTLYRVGFYTGPDYIYAKQTEIPVYGFTAGIGLPLANYSMQARYQASMINIGFEYMKRGNSKNVLSENLYRLSLGFSLTDLWFIGKTKYFED